MSSVVCVCGVVCDVMCGMCRVVVVVVGDVTSVMSSVVCVWGGLCVVV